MFTPSQIRTQVLTYWNTNYTATPTEYENSKFDGNKAQPFVSLKIKFTTSESVIVGSGTETRHYGFISVLIRTPVLTGTVAAYNLSDTITALLERKNIGGISTRAAEIDVLGNNNEYFGIAILVPFIAT